MKRNPLIIITIAIFVISFGTWLLIKSIKSPKETLTTESTQNDECLELGNPRGLKKLMVITQSNNLRENDSDHVRTISVLAHSISKGDDVIFSDDKEEITNVQESPDGKMLIFYKCVAGEYDIYRLEKGKYRRINIQLPNRDQATRVDSWYWVGNDTLIGEQWDYFDPAPQGYGDEGWVKGSRIYAVDLKNKIHFEIKPDELPKSEPDQFKVIKDEFDPTYSYEIPIFRYIKIKGITNEGIIFLESLDTSSPKGANAKDEGAFALKSE